jgi:hypothetical protein
MKPLLKRWRDIRGGDFVFLKPVVYAGKNGKERTAKIGDPVPKSLFKDRCLLGMYKNRKIDVVEPEPTETRPATPETESALVSAE